jgi:hypothetical protein
MEVSRQVAHVVDRTWVTATGEHKRQHYPARRYSPKALQQVQEALLALHDQKVQIRRKDPKTGKGRDDLVVHLLDMYGFRYEEEGKPLDVFDPPPGRVKVNVGTVDRPVWRLRRQTAEEDCDERPSGVIFRISKELASEMCGVKGSIKFTLLARRIFGLLRHFSHDPIGIRLLLLVVRQTGEEFSRRLDKLLGDLGFDPEHRARNLDRLQRTLEDLQGKGLIQGYAVDLERDEVQVRRNPSWFQDRMALEVG